MLQPPEIPLDFEDTAIAFAHQSHLDLRRAWLLFRFLGRPRLVTGGKWASRIALGLHLPIDPLIRMTLFKQFVGGESIADCEPTLALLARYGIGSILDYSAEGQQNEADFVQTQQQLQQVLQQASTDARIPFAVFKPTGVLRSALLRKATDWRSFTRAEQQEWETGVARMRDICKRAVQARTPVLIDAEESWLQGAIDRLVLDLMREFNREKAWVWNTLQMYRKDRLHYLDDLLQISYKEGFILGFKLVRGAYMEKERTYAAKQGLPSPIQPSKAATDTAFDTAVDRCLGQLERVAFCVGSHNESSHLRLLSQMTVRGLPRNHPHIWFAQLLGMSDHISFNLVRAGYNVAKYVPYAPIRHLMPYLIRRAEENTSVQGQSSRELDLLAREMRRRGLL